MGRMPRRHGFPASEDGQLLYVAFFLPLFPLLTWANSDAFRIRRSILGAVRQWVKDQGQYDYQLFQFGSSI